jgi:hypothetical protein
MSNYNEKAARDNLPSNNLIEIHDPEIDQEAIMAEIRRRIQERRHELGYLQPQFSTFGGAPLPGRPDDIPYDPDYFDHLELANELYLQVPTEVDLQASPATRVPVLGSMWAMIREQAHGLALYYVNRNVSHQAGVNREIMGVLNGMTAINLEQQRAIIRLQEEVDTLRSQLKALEEG